MVQWRRLESAWFGLGHLAQFLASRRLQPPRHIHRQIDMAQTMKKRKTSDTPSRTTSFQQKHLLEFGLEITQSEHNNVVTCVVCLFCKWLGRSGATEDDGRECNQTSNTKYWNPPFRKENFVGHLTSQHPDDFAEYKALCNQEKKKFFDARKRVRESMHRYLNSMQTVLTIPISKGIIEVIIGDMFFKLELDEDDEEMELITKTNALKLFHQQDDASTWPRSITRFCTI
jgi:hypothetical protein